MKKYLLLLCILSSLTAFSQVTLSEFAKKMNSQCPKQSGICCVESWQFSQNTIHLYASIDAGAQFNLMYFIAKPDEGKEWFKIWMTYMYKPAKYYFDRMVEKKVSFVMHLKDKSNNISHEVVLSPTDISSAIVKYANLDDDELFLNNQVVSSNVQSPQTIDPITVLEKNILNKNSLEIYYLVDDGKTSISQIEKYINKNRTDFIASFRQSYVYNDMAKALAATNRTLKFIYQGKISKKEAIITFSPEEFK